MKDSPSDFRPDPELAAALRGALEARDSDAAFAARVMAQYDHALDRATVPTVEVLASWFRPGIVAAAAVLAGFLVGRAVLAPTPGPSPASFDSALAPVEGQGLAALVTATDPPDASVVFASLVEQR